MLLFFCFFVFWGGGGGGGGCRILQLFFYNINDMNVDLHGINYDSKRVFMFKLIILGVHNFGFHTS